MKHEDIQVNKMIKDRPLLGLFIKEGDPVFNWMAEKFEHKIESQPIYWSSDELGHIITFPTAEEPAYFKFLIEGLEENKDENSEFYMMDFIKEMCKLACAQQFYDLHKKVSDDNLDLEEFVELYAEIYLQSSKDLWKFIMGIWRTFCTENNIDSGINFEEFEVYEGREDCELGALRSSYFPEDLEQDVRERFKEIKAA